MNIFVGCSSRDHVPAQFSKLAQDVGKLLKDYQVIIGGTKEGMMGKVANEVPSDHLFQIVLKDYVEEEHESTEHFRICNTSFERLELIWESSDVILFLPGGTGTLGEILTFLEENRMKQEKKHILVFNDQHYYNDILTFLEKSKKLGFCNDDILDGLVFVESLEELKNKLVEIEGD